MTTNNDWTPAIGLRRLVVSVVIRSMIASVVWGGGMLLVAAIFRGYSFSPAGRGFIIVAIPPGLVIGFILAWRLGDRVGFGGTIVGSAAALGVPASLYGGTFAALAIWPFTTMQQMGVICVMVGVFAIACVVKFAIFDY